MANISKKFEEMRAAAKAVEDDYKDKIGSMWHLHMKGGVTLEEFTVEAAKYYEEWQTLRKKAHDKYNAYLVSNGFDPVVIV